MKADSLTFILVNGVLCAVLTFVFAYIFDFMESKPLTFITFLILTLSADMRQRFKEIFNAPKR